MTRFILSNKGKVLSNAITLGNLYKLNEKQFCLKDLGRAGLVEEIRIRERVIRHLYPPLVKEEGVDGKWIVRP